MSWRLICAARLAGRHVVAEQFLADADGERAGAVERADDQRVQVAVDLGIRIALHALLFPEAQDARDLVLADGDDFVAAIDRRKLVLQAGIDGGEVRRRPHVDFVRAEGDHGRGGGALERRVKHDALEFATQEMHEPQRRLGIAAIRFKEESHRAAMLARLEQLRHRHDVVLADRAAGGGPVRQQRQAHLLFEAGEDRLGLLGQDRRALGRRRAQGEAVFGGDFGADSGHRDNYNVTPAEGSKALPNE